MLLSERAAMSMRPPVDTTLDASTLARTRLSMWLVAGDAAMAIEPPPMATEIARLAAMFLAWMAVASLAAMRMSPAASRPWPCAAALPVTRAWVSLVMALLVTLAAPAMEMAPAPPEIDNAAPTASASMRPVESARTVMVPLLARLASSTSASVVLSMWLSASDRPKLIDAEPSATAMDTAAPTEVDRISASLVARTVTLLPRAIWLPPRTRASVVLLIAFWVTAPAPDTATPAYSATDAAPAALTASASILASESAETCTTPRLPATGALTATASTTARVALPTSLMATDAPTAAPMAALMPAATASDTAAASASMVAPSLAVTAKPAPWRSANAESAALASMVLWMLFSDTEPAPATAMPALKPTPTLAAPATATVRMPEVEAALISTSPTSLSVLLSTRAVLLFWMALSDTDTPTATDTPTVPPTPTASATAPAMVSIWASSVAFTVSAPPALTVLSLMRATVALPMVATEAEPAPDTAMPAAVPAASEPATPSEKARMLALDSASTATPPVQTSVEPSTAAVVLSLMVLIDRPMPRPTATPAELLPTPSATAAPPESALIFDASVAFTVTAPACSVALAACKRASTVLLMSFFDTAPARATPMPAVPTPTEALPTMLSASMLPLDVATTSSPVPPTCVRLLVSMSARTVLTMSLNDSPAPTARPTPTPPPLAAMASAKPPASTVMRLSSLARTLTASPALTVLPRRTPAWVLPRILLTATLPARLPPMAAELPDAATLPAAPMASA